MREESRRRSPDFPSFRNSIQQFGFPYIKFAANSKLMSCTLPPTLLFYYLRQGLPQKDIHLPGTSQHGAMLAGGRVNPSLVCWILRGRARLDRRSSEHHGTVAQMEAPKTPRFVRCVEVEIWRMQLETGGWSNWGLVKLGAGQIGGWS